VTRCRATSEDSLRPKVYGAQTGFAWAAVHIIICQNVYKTQTGIAWAAVQIMYLVLGAAPFFSVYGVAIVLPLLGIPVLLDDGAPHQVGGDETETIL